MYGPEILYLFDLLGSFSLGAIAESWAQDGCRRDRFPRYLYIRDSSWCSRDVTDMMSQMAGHPWQPYIRDSSGSFSNVAEMTL
jgi:hypothetical protein